VARKVLVLREIKGAVQARLERLPEEIRNNLGAAAEARIFLAGQVRPEPQRHGEGN